MEGQGEKPPMEGAPKATSKKNKMMVIIVVVILLVAAVAVGFYWWYGNNKPSVDVTASSDQVNVGESVTFDASGSSAPSMASIDEYNFQFGDGEQAKGDQAVVEHAYAYPGQYYVLVTVKSSNGASADNFGKIIRLNVLDVSATSPTNQTKPVAIAAVSSDSISKGSQVNFSAASSLAFGWDDASGGVIADPSMIQTYTWIFGDGTANGNGSEVNHTYDGKQKVYISYVTILSVHGAVNRYYNCIIVDAEVGAVKNPDTFVYVSIAEPDYLDPAVDYETGGGEILQNTMETLIWYDNETLTLKPMLATEVPTVANGLVSADGLTYTFNLRPNVKFHNNETMTAADVIYSIKRVLMINDPDGPAWMLGEILIPDYYNYDGRTNASWAPGGKWPGYIPEANCSKAFYAVDSDTVKFNLTTPVPYFLYVMAFCVASITSEKYVEEHGGITPGEQNAWMNRHICGTGPYMLKSWDANQQVVMERWDGYWRTPASIQYVIIKKATDYGTRLMMLQAGDADGIDFPRIQRSDIEGNDKIVINTNLPTFTMDFLGLNQNINKTNSPAKDDSIPSNFFADINVRRAFASSFDYDKAMDTYFKGTAIQPRSVIPKGMFGYSDAVPLYTFNLTAAANYLNNAPSDTPGKSWGEKGFTITLMYNSGNVWRELECMILAEGLSKLSSQGLVSGKITATALGLDWPTYLATNRGNGLTVFFLGWAPDYADPNNYVGPFLHSSGTFAKRCGIDNATITNWINVAAVNLTDSVRADLYYNISMGCYDNCYYILTAQSTNFDVLQSYVQGYYFNPMYSNFYYYAFSK